MKTITLHFPDSLDIDERELSVMIAAQLYDSGRLSLGQAADLVGMTKAEFMESLGKHGVSIFGETIEDLKRDLASE